MTSTLTGQVNAFHRRLLRMVINIRWPDKINNDDIRTITKHTDGVTIYERRFRWCGNLLRMSEDTPARRALAEAEMDERRPKGRPKLTWLALMKQYLAKHEINQKGAKEPAQDRVCWRSFKWRITAAMHPACGS